MSTEPTAKKSKKTKEPKEEGEGKKCNKAKESETCADKDKTCAADKTCDKAADKTCDKADKTCDKAADKPCADKEKGAEKEKKKGKGKKEAEPEKEKPAEKAEKPADKEADKESKKKGKGEKGEKGKKEKEGKEKDKPASQPAASAAAAAPAEAKEEKSEGTKKKSSSVRKSKKDETSASASAAASQPSGAKFRVHYFNGRGLGELARLCLAYGDIQFDDVRYNQETFKPVKAEMPFGQMPVLECVEEKFKLSESAAVHHYTARLAGLLPSFENARDFAYNHMLTEGVRDVSEPWATINFRTPEEQKAEKLKEYREKTLPMWVDRYEALLIKNGGKFLVGNKRSLADMAVYNIFAFMQEKFPECLDKAPTLQGLAKSISEEPNIAKYLANRPKGDF